MSMKKENVFQQYTAHARRAHKIKFLPIIFSNFKYKLSGKLVPQRKVENTEFNQAMSLMIS